MIKCLNVTLLTPFLSGFVVVDHANLVSSFFGYQIYCMIEEDKVKCIFTNTLLYFGLYMEYICIRKQAHILN